MISLRVVVVVFAIVEDERAGSVCFFSGSVVVCSSVVTAGLRVGLAFRAFVTAGTCGFPAPDWMSTSSEPKFDDADDDDDDDDELAAGDGGSLVSCS
ncbi:hypothetical protein Hanom_Chr13g01183931 [Helianthus anomalus]